jgi:hypothetical protein
MRLTASSQHGRAPSAGQSAVCRTVRAPAAYIVEGDTGAHVRTKGSAVHLCDGWACACEASHIISASLPDAASHGCAKNEISHACAHVSIETRLARAAGTALSGGVVPDRRPTGAGRVRLCCPRVDTYTLDPLHGMRHASVMSVGLTKGGQADDIPRARRRETMSSRNLWL